MKNRRTLCHLIIKKKFKEYKQVRTDIDSAKELLNDKELHELAQMEILTGEEKLIKIEFARGENDESRILRMCGESVYENSWS